MTREEEDQILMGHVHAGAESKSGHTAEQAEAHAASVDKADIRAVVDMLKRAAAEIRTTLEPEFADSPKYIDHLRVGIDIARRHLDAAAKRIRE